MTLHIQPDFSGLIPAGKKIQPQAPVPRSKAKTPGKAEAKTRGEQTPTKTKTRNRPAWMSETTPDPASMKKMQAEGERIAKGETITITPDMMEQEETTGNLALEPIDYPRGGAISGYDKETRDEAIRRIIEDGRSIISVCREMHLDRRAVSAWLTEYRQDIDAQGEAHDIRQIVKLEDVSYQIVETMTKDKMSRAGIKDLGIVYGILRDKLKDLRGPRSGGNSLHLRAVFRGEGAIEVHTGD